MRGMKRIVVLALLLSLLMPALVAQAEPLSCRAVFEACQRWCQANRGGPERFVCKGNCQIEFNASLNSGIFHREDGLSVECLAVPHVVWWPGLKRSGS